MTSFALALCWAFGSVFFHKREVLWFYEVTFRNCWSNSLAQWPHSTSASGFKQPWLRNTDTCGLLLLKDLTKEAKNIYACELWTPSWGAPPSEGLWSFCVKAQPGILPPYQLIHNNWQTFWFSVSQQLDKKWKWWSLGRTTTGRNHSLTYQH